MSLVLLVGAGLFLQTLENLEGVDVGFDSKNLLMFNVNPRINGYDVDRSSRVFHQILERMATVPGVTSAALTRLWLFSGDHKHGTDVEAGANISGSNRREHVHDGRLAGVLRDDGDSGPAGPSFIDCEGAAGPKVAILNEAAARRLFPDGDVLGRRIGESFEKSGEFEVVGVVRDANRERSRSRPTDDVSVRVEDHVKGTCTSCSGPPGNRGRSPTRCGSRCAKSTRRWRFRSHVA